jgi:hypothetical protein
VPWNDDFKLSSFNYAPLVLVVGLIVAIWWQLGAKNRYNGPVRTIDEEEFGPVAAEPGAPVTRPPESGPPATPPPTPA